MKTHPSQVPHFLRVAQALALVSGIGAPAAGLLLVSCGGAIESDARSIHDSGGPAFIDAPGANRADTSYLTGLDSSTFTPGVDSGVVFDATLGPGDAGDNDVIGIGDGPSGADTAPDFDSEIPDVLGVLDSNVPDVLGVADSGGPADAHDEINGVQVMPDTGAKDAPDDGAMSGGGPGVFPDLPA